MDREAIPIRSPMQITTPLPLTIMYNNHTVGLATSRGEEGVHFQHNGETFVGEDAFMSQVLRHMNRYPTRHAVHASIAELRCSHAHIGWSTLSWSRVKDRCQWFVDEVWIHTNLIAEERRSEADSELEEVDVVMTDSDLDSDVPLMPVSDGDEEEGIVEPFPLPPVPVLAPPRRRVRVIRRVMSPPPPPPPPPPETCSVCAENIYGGLLLKHLQSIGDCHRKQRVVPSCGYAEHAMCAGCLYRTATNWSHHSIGPANHDAVLCPHEGCNGRYPVEDFAGLLSVGDMAKLRERRERFARSGAVKCPVCDQIMHFDAGLLRDAQPGSAAQRCLNCNNIACYHCLRSVHAARFAVASEVGMHPCSCGAHGRASPRSGTINRWFQAPSGCVGPLARNSELRTDECRRQIEALCASEEVIVQCAHCATPMHRSCACMELTHCGIKRCAVCGLSGLEHESVLVDHWHGNGTRCGGR